MTLILIGSAGPLISLWLLEAQISEARHPRIAYGAILATATPPLYALTGLITFMSGFPIYRNTVWYLFVVSCFIMTLLPIPTLGSKSNTLRKAHFICAIPVGIFSVFHILNAFMGIFSLEIQNETLVVLRSIYRFLPLEVLLITSIIIIIFTGVPLALRHVSINKGNSILKAMSGIYLAVFMTSHSIAVLILGRGMLKVNTDYLWAGGGEVGILFNPYSTYLIPYYLLSIVAFFVHISYAVLPRLSRSMSAEKRSKIAKLLTKAGYAFASIILLSLSGWHFFD